MLWERGSVADGDLEVSVGEAPDPIRTATGLSSRALKSTQITIDEVRRNRS